MRFLIRRITRTKAGKAYRDSVVEADALTIGRATNQHVFLSDLRVQLEHAILYALPDGRYSIKSKAAAGLQVNGRLTQADIVRPGDVITISSCHLRLKAPGKNLDSGDAACSLIIEVEEKVEQAKDKSQSSSVMSLQQAGLRKRPIAWLLFLVTLGACLLLPMSDSLFAPDGFIHKYLPGDSAWESGTLSSAHAFFGEQCKDCHQQPFVMVKNAACLECHKTQPAHSDNQQLLKMVGLTNLRCASCHREHNGPRGVITTAQALCSDCHADPKRMNHAPHPTQITSFGTDHPGFRIRLLEHTKTGWVAKRVAPDTGKSDEQLQEQSGLIFPHDMHLNAEGIEGPYGLEVLACASCHLPESGNIALQPITMKGQCIRCHTLGFEPSDPMATVPHGDVEQLHDYLQQYYARRALQGGYEGDTAPAVVQQRRLPSEALKGKKREAALQWANQKAATVAEEVFAYRICTTCHLIDKGKDGAWSVAPVKLNQDWMPAARFTHAPHLTMQCTDCHAAEASTKSTDVLMPTITQCRDCHGGEKSTARVASTCIACHKFHQAKFYLMGKDVELDDDTGLLFKH